MGNDVDLTGSTIWVVDDDVDYTFLLERILSKAGATVRTFSDGPQALSESARETPELILLDVTMPGMDGYEACRQLKSAPATSQLPVIFLSGRSGSDEVVKGLAAGAVDYLAKPCHKEEVLARVRTHLALARARRELTATNAELKKEIQQRKAVEEEREGLIRELENALEKIRKMAPLIPICANCRKVRDDSGYWTRIERYLTESTGSMVTHGICPDCAKELYSDLDKLDES